MRKSADSQFHLAHIFGTCNPANHKSHAIFRQSHFTRILVARDSPQRGLFISILVSIFLSCKLRHYMSKSIPICFIMSSTPANVEVGPPYQLRMQIRTVRARWRQTKIPTSFVGFIWTTAKQHLTCVWEEENINLPRLPVTAWGVGLKTEQGWLV